MKMKTEGEALLSLGRRQAYGLDVTQVSLDEDIIKNNPENNISFFLDHKGQFVLCSRVSLLGQ